MTDERAPWIPPWMAVAVAAGAISCAIIVRMLMEMWQFLAPWDVERHDKTSAAAIVAGCLASLSARRWWSAGVAGAAAALLGFWVAYVTLDRTTRTTRPTPMIGLIHPQAGAVWYYVILGAIAGAVAIAAYNLRRTIAHRGTP